MDKEKLVGAYVRTFSGASGQAVLDDLRDWCKIDEMAGDELTHQQLTYRAAQQDMYKYIKGLSDEA